MRARHIWITAFFLVATRAPPSRRSRSSRLPASPPARIRSSTARPRAKPPVGAARLYFRWEERGGFYWVEMEHDGPGRFWAVPPNGERNLQIEYYGALLDAGGHEISRSQPRKVAVKSDCHVELTPQQKGVAQNLTVGETSAAQAKGEVMGFLCDGRGDPRQPQQRPPFG